MSPETPAVPLEHTSWVVERAAALRRAGDLIQRLANGFALLARTRFAIADESHARPKDALERMIKARASIVSVLAELARTAPELGLEAELARASLLVEAGVEGAVDDLRFALRFQSLLDESLLGSGAPS